MSLADRLYDTMPDMISAILTENEFDLRDYCKRWAAAIEDAPKGQALEGIIQFIENSVHAGFLLTENETPLDGYGKEVASEILGVVRDCLKGDEK